MKIANIIFEKDLINHKKVDFINYYQVNDTNFSYDHNLPTLFVGWHFMKKINENNDNIQNANILKHRIIRNKLYWEFSFEENKSSHVKGINSFVKNVPDFYFAPKYQYINLDPVFYQIKNNQDLFDVIPKMNKIDAYYQYKDRMIYLLSENKIYGLDIEMYNFFKFNVTSIIDNLQGMNGNIFKDIDGKDYQKYYKFFPEFTHLKRYLVVLLSK